ncbi:transposase [Clostridium amazonitimonense]|uniref:transposase n=1 Tax=Clostridium amazonitimonense TaxID=1499689 RepID=UPI000509F87B|nr:transposase [Clostridium amazonitimonense]
MGYQKRTWYPGVIYHITSRGNRKEIIYKDIRDRYVFLNIIENSLEYYKGEFSIICYCIMSNHFHLMIETKDTHIKHFMSRINSQYAKYFNEKYEYVGYLFQGRYYSQIIDSDLEMMEVSRYIHLNPVRANIVKKPEHYIWSSYSMYLGIGKKRIIQTEKLIDCFNTMKNYKMFVEEEVGNG